MIFINRASITPPASLTLSGEAGERERKRAKKFYATPKAARMKKAKPAKKKGAEADIDNPKSFNFSAYKCEDVKEALETLFNKKCAYCESSYKSVISIQIEHFRPKKRIAEESTHEGYWWLASSWDNLLPSCVHCNGAEYHKLEMIDGEPPYLQDFKEGEYKLGKYDFFPISGTRASKELDDISLEDAHLIDPTKRKPEDHLRWITDGPISVVTPKEVDGEWDKYGFATYRIFGLNRKNLVEERTTLLLQIKSEILRARRFFERAAKMPDGEDRMFLIEEAMLIVEAMQSKALPSEPYSMMVRSLLNTDLSALISEFSDTLM